MKNLLLGVLILLSFQSYNQDTLGYDLDFDCKSGVLTLETCEGVVSTYLGCLIEGGCTECDTPPGGGGGCEKCIEDIYVNNGQICFVFKGVAEPDCHNLDNTDLDQQYIDMFRILNDQLYISISNDGRDPSIVDLQPLKQSIINEVINIIPDKDLETFSFNCDDNTATIKLGNQIRKMDLSCLVPDIDDLAPQDLIMSLNCSSSLLTYNLTNDPTGGGVIDLSCLADALVDTDNQNITDFSLSGNTLSITLEDGNTQTVDLSSLIGENTDDQKITTFAINGTILTITIENGNTRTVDLGAVISESYEITDFYVLNNTLTIKQEGGIVKSVNLAPYLGNNTDDQQITTFTLDGSNLTIALEDGGSKSVNLGTVACGCDDQLITNFSIDSNTLSITIENGNTTTVNLGDIGTDYVYTVSADSGTPEDITNGETLQIRGSNLIETSTQTNRVDVGISPGDNTQIMVTNGGNPTWYSIPPCVAAPTGFLCWEDCGDGKKTVYIKG